MHYIVDRYRLFCHIPHVAIRIFILLAAMNARSQKFDVVVENYQLEEAVSSIFHTLLVHRTVGKFNYKAEGSYSIGTIGVEDADCDTLDLTFVRVNSPELINALRQQILNFKETLRQSECQRAGQISLEFYQKRRRQWPFKEEQVPWEVWTLNVEIIQLCNELARQRLRETAAEAISEIILEICCSLNKQQYVPKMPVQSDLGLVFDTSFTDVQPYLFKVVGNVGPVGPQYVSSAVQKILKGTLSL